jgi:hypothetical protein
MTTSISKATTHKAELTSSKLLSMDLVYGMDANEYTKTKNNIAGNENINTLFASKPLRNGN